jgi:hypothetical protein
MDLMGGFVLVFGEMGFAFCVLAIARRAHAGIVRITLGEILDQSSLVRHFLREGGLGICGDDLVHGSEHAGVIATATMEAELDAHQLLGFLAAGGAGGKCVIDQLMGSGIIA